MKNPRKITDLESLQAEKERLRLLANRQQAVIQEDIQHLKASLAPMELLNKLATKIVPAIIRHSPVVNTPINFLASVLFKKTHNVVDPRSDKGPGNRNRNIALGVAEGLGTWLLGRALKSKLRKRERED
jgi:hypothetical protein